MSKADMVKEVKEQSNNKEALPVNNVVTNVEAELKELYTEFENLLKVQGNPFYVHLDETLELTLKSVEIVDKSTKDTKGNCVVARKYIHVTFIGDDVDAKGRPVKADYPMELFCFYYNTSTGAHLNLMDSCRTILQSIVDVTKSKTLNQAIGKKLCVTSYQRVSAKGTPYTKYRIEAAE